jgi:hypothetical protein
VEYTQHQLTIIRRMGAISARIRDAAAAHRAAQAEEAQHLIDAVSALRRAMDRAEEMGRLTTEHGDAFREFLDTL